MPTRLFPRLFSWIRLTAREIASGYGVVVFLDSPFVGVGLIIASFIHPNSAICGLLGIFSAILLCDLMGLKFGLLRRLILYNALLTGLFMGFLFKIDGLAAGIVVLAVCLSTLIAVSLDSLFYSRAWPVLSFSFAITATLIALSKFHLTNLIDAAPYFIEHTISNISPFQKNIEIFFRSIGAIFCIPDPLFGGAVIALVFLRSPLLGILFTFGFMVGFSWEALLRFGPVDHPMTHYFNYSLTFAAISVVFLTPSKRSIGLALMATVLVSFIALGSLSFWGIFQIPIVPFPYNFTVLLMISASRWILPAQAKGSYSGTPELTLEQARLFRIRQRSGEIGLFCPFKEEWGIQQGFDGQWTHRGNWKHALDFVIYGQDGKTFKNQGFNLEDYHCFGKPVYSPVEGYVAAVFSKCSDNVIGTVDNQNNWGNYAIIRSHFGYYVILAHLKKDSIQVNLGDLVAVGASLAQCGNSGYSQEPHLHLQTQWVPTLGGFTVPFHLLNFRRKENLILRGLPNTGERIEPVSPNLALDRALVFKIGDCFRFNLSQLGRANQEVQISVKLDEVQGLLYLTDGSSKLFFGRLGTHHYFYGYDGALGSPLGDLFSAAPRVPLIYGNVVKFEDILPLSLSASTLGRWVCLIKEFFGIFGFDQTILYQMDPALLEIKSKNTGLKLDPALGILQFKCGERNYERFI